MKPIQRIPAQDQWIISQLHKAGYKSAIIAGGAIRDAYFGKQPKDIDVYVWHPSVSGETVEFNTPAKMAEHLGTTSFVRCGVDGTEVDVPGAFSPPKHQRKQQAAAGSMAGRSSKHIHSVFAAERNGRKYDFIFVKCAPKTYVRTYFDIGLCKCWFDGSRVHYSHDFLYDATNNTISLVGRMNETELFGTLTGHVLRMQKKFPGYDVRIDPLRITAED